MPDRLGFASFEVDHVIARAHGGSSELSNLAWACLLCNVGKGPNIASVDPLTGKTVPLFHPRRNRWGSHFQLAEGLVLARTAAGRATLTLLNLNQPQTFGLRRVLEQIDSRYARLVVRRHD